jgi:hypothetical protein
MSIRIIGAREHNLLTIDVEFGDGLTVITGISGSGKTSLVFDTLYHEARRRFLDAFALGSHQRLSPAAVGSIVGVEPSRGLFTLHARYDIALILDLYWRVGASREDERIAGLVAFARELQRPYGLWKYHPRPQASRWLTFDVIRSLHHLDETSDWVSLEPRTPFREYPKQRKRY